MNRYMYVRMQIKYIYIYIIGINNMGNVLGHQVRGSDTMYLRQ